MDPYEHSSRSRQASYPPARNVEAPRVVEQHQNQNESSAYWLNHQEYAHSPIPVSHPPPFSEPLYVPSSMSSATTSEIAQLSPALKYDLFSFDQQMHHASPDRHLNRLVQPIFAPYDTASTPGYTGSPAEPIRGRLDEAFQDPKGALYDRTPSSPESAQSSGGKRRAQNREAQRAFRARKQQHIKDIEKQLSDLREKYRQLQDSHDELQGSYENLRRAVGLNAQEDIESRIETLKKLLDSVQNSQDAEARIKKRKPSI